ncbi:MAG: linear amide C-N hydrolase [Oscillospiraceae bacterium]|nr:linear amide C-N hydrolase [Oscillospiraceae bacterium]
MRKEKKIFFRLLMGIGIALLMGFIAVLILFWNELRSLASLKKVDDYGMYQMTYYGDYGFDEFLKTGAGNDGDIEAFITKRLLKGLPIDLGVTGDGCTAFVVKSENSDVLFGRNFDFTYAPSLQLYTAPENGYASVSTVNLAFVGYSESNLPEGSLFECFLTLAAPFLPFDGMNERGLAIALLAVPEAEAPYHPDKVTLNTTTAIRLVLDHAATVEEAIELLKQYNIYFSGDIECHYLIADASGYSAIVEFVNHELCVVETEAEYQIASNFIAYDGLDLGEGFTEFERYDKVQNAIETNGGMLEADQAVQLLAEVGVFDGGMDKLQWSVLYNLTTGGGDIFANRNTNHMIEFTLPS